MASLAAPPSPGPLDGPARPSTRGRYLRLLTNAQLGSGLVFSSFLLVHVIPPVLIAVTGEERAGSAFMLLGRVYYQSPLGEPVIVYGSLAAHLLSSTLKRVLSPVRPLHQLSAIGRSSHALVGWALVLPLMYHVLTHRLGPSVSAPPINSLSPAELDYSFVAGAVELYPLGSRIAYGALGALALWHAVGGLAIVRRRWAPAGTRLLDKLIGGGRRSTLGDSSSSSSLNPSPVAPTAIGKLTPSVKRSWLFTPRALSTIVGSSLIALAIYRLEHDAFVPAHLSRRIAESHRILLPWLFK